LDKALELDIKGFTKNLPDGKVYVEAESDDDQKLSLFIDWLSTCSPLSEVKEVKIIKEDTCKNYKNFKILK
jgi:acylphosphatase